MEGMRELKDVDVSWIDESGKCAVLSQSASEEIKTF